MASCDFDTKITNTRPHILEIICLFLDYETFKNCVEVNKSWKAVLTSKTFQKRAKYAFKEKIQEDEYKLLRLSKEGKTVEISRLLSSGIVDVNCTDDEGNTPVYNTALNGKKEVLKLLLGNGAEPDKADKKGRTPLHVAASKGEKKLAQILLDGGADPNKANHYGSTALHWAAKNGHKDMAQLLLDVGADPNGANKVGWTVLHAAVLSGQINLVQLLLDSGAHPKADKDGRSLLHIAVDYAGHPGAALKDSKEFVQLFLDRGVDPNKADKYGVIPLHWAAGNGHKDLVQILLERGADPNRGDDDGSTPLSLAHTEGHVEIVKIMKEEMDQ